MKPLFAYFFKSISFGTDLARLWLFRNSKQLWLRLDDHKKPYTGKKIPLSITYSITHGCNFQCAHCGVDIDNARVNQDLPPERMATLVDEMAKAGVVRIGFTGGEPLLKKKLGELIDKCHKQGMMINVSTNGWLVPEHIDELKNIDLMVVSIDGTEQTHDSIRSVKGSYQKALNAIRLAKENNIPVLANVCVMDRNIDVVPDLIKIFERENIKWSIAPYLEGFNNIKKWQKDVVLHRPEPKALKSLNQIIATSNKSCNSNEYLKAVEAGGGNTSYCFAGIGYAIVTAKGELYPCLPAQDDPEFEGMDLTQMSFEEAFKKMPLYRSRCDICDVICHSEQNSLYGFKPSAIKKALYYLRP